MKTTFKKNDIVISKTFSLDKNNNPFRRVTQCFIGRQKNGKEREFLFTEGMRTPHLSKDFRLVRDEDYLIYHSINNNIKYIATTDDINQHYSSINGEVKIPHNDEIEAYKSAFKMSYMYGGEWVIYKCNVCEKYHIGKEQIVL